MRRADEKMPAHLLTSRSLSLNGRRHEEGVNPDTLKMEINRGASLVEGQDQEMRSHAFTAARRVTLSENAEK